MRADGVRVLVVGAGIAGLAAARTLRGWGAAVEIAERAPVVTTRGAGIFLPANGVAALDVLGLGDQVRARATRIECQRVSDHRGRHLFEVGLADIWDGVGPCLALTRSDLHDVLVSGAQDVPISWGRGPTAILDTPDDLQVTFTDGSVKGYDLVGRVGGRAGAHPGCTPARLGLAHLGGRRDPLRARS